MIQVQNMQQPAQGVTAELYSQVEDYLALGKPGVENETSTQKSSTRKVIKKSSSKSTSSSGSVENTDEWTLGVKVNGKTIYGDAAEIVGRMVEAEMGASFQEEALKAQAVAAYTYVRYHNENGSCPQVVAKDDVSDKVEDAVNEVIGQAIYYDGEYIDATYCASNAGQSMDAEHVLGRISSISGQRRKPRRYLFKSIRCYQDLLGKRNCRLSGRLSGYGSLFLQ